MTVRCFPCRSYITALKCPEVCIDFAVLKLAYCIFPLIAAHDACTFNDTTARKAKESRAYIFKSFKQILSENTGYCVFRNHGNKVKLKTAGLCKRNDKVGALHIIQGCKLAFVVPPLEGIAGNADCVHPFSRTIL